MPIDDRRDRTDRDALRRAMFPDLSDEMFTAFMEACEVRKLSPWCGQAFPKLTYDSVLRRPVLNVMLGIEGFRLIAHRTGVYAGCLENKFEYDENGRITRAIATVFKLVGDHRCEFTESVRMAEYIGIPSQIDVAFRHQMPHMWLGKIAEAAALRKAFPQELGGIYTPEEMEQADNRQGPPPAPIDDQPTYADDGSQLPDHERVALTAA